MSQKDLWVAFHYIYGAVGFANKTIITGLGKLAKQATGEKKSNLNLAMGLYGVISAQIYSILPAQIIPKTFKISQLDPIVTPILYDDAKDLQLPPYASYLTLAGYTSSVLCLLGVSLDYSIPASSGFSYALSALSLSSAFFCGGTIIYHVKDPRFFQYKSIPFTGYFFSLELFISSVGTNIILAQKSYAALPYLIAADDAIGTIGAITAGLLSKAENFDEQ